MKDVDVDNVSQQLQDLETALETERGQLDVHKQQIKDFVDNK